MKHLILAAALTLSPLPAMAQETGEPEGLSLMEEGARLFLRGLMSEIEPTVDDLQGLMAEMGPQITEMWGQMGPAFRGLLSQIDDWSFYEAPEVLPNGDIILRRKVDAPELPKGDVEI